MTNFFARHPSHGSAIPARRAAQQQQEMVEAPHLHAAAKDRAARPAAAAHQHEAGEVPPIISPVFSPNLHTLERLHGGHFHPRQKHEHAVRLYRAGKQTTLEAPHAAAAAAAKPAATARPPLPTVATAPRRHQQQQKQHRRAAAAAAAPLSVRIRHRLDRLIDGDAAHLRERLGELVGDSFIATIPARIAAIPRAINTSESLRVLGLAALAARRFLNKLAGEKAPAAAAAARRFVGTERGPLLESRRGRDAAVPAAHRQPHADAAPRRHADTGARQAAGARRAGAAFSLPLSLQLRRLAVQIGRRLRRRGLSSLSDVVADLPSLKLPSLSLPRLSLPRMNLPELNLPQLNLERLNLPNLRLNLPRVAGNIPAAIAAALLVPAMRAAYDAGAKANAGRAARAFARTRLDAPFSSAGSSLGNLYHSAARAVMSQLPVSNEMWFQMLERPAWALPLRAADMVWTAACACMAVACYRLLTAPAALGTRARALFAFGVQLALCAMCGLITMSLRSPVAGLVHHLLFAGAVIRTLTTASRVDGLAAAALVPVVGLVLFECLVQAFVVAKN